MKINYGSVTVIASLGSLNISPASTATSPNWVGSFSNFQVIGSK